MVHHVLEGSGGVAKAEIHNHWFIETILRLERCFMLISILDVYFVETPFYVKLRKDK